MATTNYTMTTTENWYRDYFQGLWNQATHRARELSVAFRLLTDGGNAINTVQAENIARELAQIESQQANFYPNLASGLQRQENVLRTKLSNATDDSTRRQIRVQLDNLDAARVGLSRASGDWAPPDVSNYTANGKTFSNIDGSWRFDETSLIGQVQSTLSSFTGLFDSAANAVTTVRELFTTTPKTQADLCRLVIDEMVTRVVTGFLPAPIPSGVSFGVEFWSKELWKEGASSPFKKGAGGVCQIFIKRDLWEKDLRDFGLSYDENSDFEYFGITVAETDFNSALNDAYALENTIQRVGQGKIASANDVLSAYQLTMTDVSAGLGDLWTGLQVKALATAAQADAANQGIDTTNANWVTKLTGDAKYFATLQNNVDEGVVDLNGLAETVEEYVNENYATGTSTLTSAIPSLIDALSVLKAIQSGQPLPILTSGLRLANSLVNPAGQPITNIELSGAANAASGILSLYSLNAALERGDTLGAFTAGAQAITFGATAYANFTGFSATTIDPA